MAISTMEVIDALNLISCPDSSISPEGDIPLEIYFIGFETTVSQNLVREPLHKVIHGQVIVGLECSCFELVIG